VTRFSFERVRVNFLPNKADDELYRGALKLEFLVIAAEERRALPVEVLGAQL